MIKNKLLRVENGKTRPFSSLAKAQRLVQPKSRAHPDQTARPTSFEKQTRLARASEKRPSLK